MDAGWTRSPGRRPHGTRRGPVSDARTGVPGAAGIPLEAAVVARMRWARDGLLAELTLLEADLATDEEAWSAPARSRYRDARAGWEHSRIALSRIIDSLENGPAAPREPPDMSVPRVPADPPTLADPAVREEPYGRGARRFRGRGDRPRGRRR